jgi:uncharacterized protein (DUF2147 family)
MLQAFHNSLLRAIVAAGALAAVGYVAGGCSPAAAAVPQGVWLLKGKAAVEIYSCHGMMCGRVLWLRIPRNPRGEPVVDKKNPDPALRRRPICGLTIIGGLTPDRTGRWTGGWFYNPDDGVKYKAKAQLMSDNVISARAFLLTPLFGETLTLARVPHGVTDGWC